MIKRGDYIIERQVIEQAVLFAKHHNISPEEIFQEMIDQIEKEMTADHEEGESSIFIDNTELCFTYITPTYSDDTEYVHKHPYKIPVELEDEGQITSLEVLHV